MDRRDGCGRAEHGSGWPGGMPGGCGGARGGGADAGSAGGAARGARRGSDAERGRGRRAEGAGGGAGGGRGGAVPGSAAAPFPALGPTSPRRLLPLPPLPRSPPLPPPPEVLLQIITCPLPLPPLRPPRQLCNSWSPRPGRGALLAARGGRAWLLPPPGAPRPPRGGGTARPGASSAVGRGQLRVRAGGNLPGISAAQLHVPLPCGAGAARGPGSGRGSAARCCPAAGALGPGGGRLRPAAAAALPRRRTWHRPADFLGRGSVVNNKSCKALAAFYTPGEAHPSPAGKDVKVSHTLTSLWAF